MEFVLLSSQPDRTTCATVTKMREALWECGSLLPPSLRPACWPGLAFVCREQARGRRRLQAAALPKRSLPLRLATDFYVQVPAVVSADSVAAYKRRRSLSIYVQGVTNEQFLST
jgi:hypothetical protein